MQLTGVILAGGKSSRFGSDKALFEINGKTMLSKAVDIINKVAEQVIISGSRDFKNYNVVPDAYKNCGPLGGILTTLEVAMYEDVIYIPCDMPCLKIEMLERLKNKHKKGSITVFINNTGELIKFPLIISKKALHKIKDQIESKNYKIEGILNYHNLQTVELNKFQNYYFTNINFKSDLNNIK